MWEESIFKTLIWLGQKLPMSWRVALTQLGGAAWLRRLTLLPLREGRVVVSLSAPLEGYRMRLDMRAGHRRYALGTYEPEVSSLIQSHLGGGETVLDIGANIGYFSLLMAHMVGPTGRVIAFEPFPPVYAMLCENLQLNNLYWVQAERMAVADREGEMRIQSEPDNPLSSTVRLSESGDLTVSLISLDHYAQTAGLTRVDFAKIDVEGAEDSVVRGVTKTLETFHPVVLVEIHSNDGGESEGLSKLKELGYQLKRLEDGEWVSCDTSARSGHVVGIP